jgi:hypothetical protein
MPTPAVKRSGFFIKEDELATLHRCARSIGTGLGSASTSPLMTNGSTHLGIRPGVVINDHMLRDPRPALLVDERSHSVTQHVKCASLPVAEGPGRVEHGAEILNAPSPSRPDRA